MRWRKVRSVLSLAVLLAVLSSGTLRPQPARAVSTAVIIVSSIAGYVVLVIGLTWIIYGHRYNDPDQDQDLVATASGANRFDDRLRDQFDTHGVRTVPNCRITDGQVPLLCW